jgi:hypothetical protein
MTTHIIILYLACFCILVWQFFSFRHEIQAMNFADKNLELAREKSVRLINVETQIADLHLWADQVDKRLNDLEKGGE